MKRVLFFSTVEHCGRQGLTALVWSHHAVANRLTENKSTFASRWVKIAANGEKNSGSTQN
jgi:hypothetical protein